MSYQAPQRDKSKLPKMKAFLAFWACLVATVYLAGDVSGNGFTECTAPECVKPYTWSKTTVDCVEEEHSATFDCRWKSGMNSRMDEIVYGGRIIAYKLQWFSGGWSDWFVPGMNDFDPKYNNGPDQSCSVPFPANGLRKAWAYFYDHKFKIIICKNPSGFLG